MPSAPTIRRILIEALGETLIPTLHESPSMPMMLADLPPHVPHGIKVAHLPIAPLQSAPDKVFHLVQSWPEARVNSNVYPYLIFLFEGAANLRMGTTVEMVLRQSARSGAKNDPWVTTGCHILSVSSPAVLLFPAGVPYSDGSDSHWILNDPQVGLSQIMWLHVLSAGVLCHLSTSASSRDGTEHPLLIEDEGLTQLIHLFGEELRQRSDGHQAVAHSLLTAIFLRLHRRLKRDKPIIGNSAWKRSVVKNVIRNEANQEQAARCIAAVDEYVQTYLAQPITVPQLAASCHLSPTHLNRVFQSSLGMSVKRYVNQQRIFAAQRILLETDLAVKEIASIVGFKQANHFCQAFRQIAHVSPRRYRERAASGASTRRNRSN